METKTLIDEAVKMCGSQVELAKRIGIEPQDVSALKKGKRPLTPETVALLAEVLNLPADQTQRLAALAIIENPKNASKRDRLTRAFFGYAFSVFVVLLGIQHTDSLAANAPETRQNQPNSTQNALIMSLSAGISIILMQKAWGAAVRKISAALFFLYCALQNPTAAHG